jgi:hypothetical protein
MAEALVDVWAGESAQELEVVWVDGLGTGSEDGSANPSDTVWADALLAV